MGGAGLWMIESRVECLRIGITIAHIESFAAHYSEFDQCCSLSAACFFKTGGNSCHSMNPCEYLTLALH